jgi:serine/threonine protein kinase
MPFGGDTHENKLVSNVTCNVRFPDRYFAGTSDNLISFLRALITSEPETRMSASEALAHPWLQKIEKHYLRIRSQPEINTTNPSLPLGQLSSYSITPETVDYAR